MNAYLYSLPKDGGVVERVVILSRKRGSDYAVAVCSGGQRVIVSASACTLHNDTMWSKSPQKNVYIQKMVDAMLQRRGKYQEKVAFMSRRLAKIRSCAG